MEILLEVVLLKVLILEIETYHLPIVSNEVLDQETQNFITINANYFLLHNKNMNL